jgi:hypothetical protein
VAELIAAQTGSPPDEQTIAAVVRATEGTPLFVSEVVRSTVTRDGPSHAGLPQRVLVPDGVQPAIRATSRACG